MKEYTYSEARQRFASLLERARKDGAVRIRRKDGSVFVLQPAAPVGSPLDVPVVDLKLGCAEIVKLVRESRRRA